MKKIFGTVVLGTILLTTVNVKAANTMTIDNSNMFETRFILNDDNFSNIYIVKMVKK